MNLNNCIFYVDKLNALTKLKCSFDRSWAFNGIICKNHLSNVYGLDAHYFPSSNKIENTLVGPYLRVVENFNFEPKEVILPSRKFFDDHFRPDKSETDSENYHMSMSTRIIAYVGELLANLRDELRPAMRYQYEVLRNLSVVSNDDVTLGSVEHIDNFENFNSYLKMRIQTLNENIRTSKTNPLFKNNQIYIVHSTLETLDKLSPFYKFLISNCMFDLHSTPVPNTVVATIDHNMVYEEHVGFYATTYLPHPLALSPAGKQVGTHKYYYLVTAIYQRDTIPMSMDPRKYPDQRTVKGHLTAGSEDCLF
ncbi:hypothetical protein AVEN_57376-1 [Araneus ventricosus]|uniref:Uncharacterized protein n=1 Tax=Araneus ventricosus TaxID=182803 RepID=A0A4Y2S6J6_ARAVE|nr:hypothetical protein AVEN_57376-1 [Araneus ventricosus]